MVLAAEAVVAIVAALSPNGDTPLPASEAQADELAPLRAEPEAMAAVWDEAVEVAGAEARPVTAADVREARDKAEKDGGR